MSANKSQFSHKFQNQITNEAYCQILTEKSITMDTANILKTIKINNIKWRNGDIYFTPSEEDIKNELIFLGYMCITENFTNISSRGFTVTRTENDILFKFDVINFKSDTPQEINIALKQLLYEGSIFQTLHQGKQYYNARKYDDNLN